MNIYEVARKAGVSIATVSRVINNSPNVRRETREKVEKVLKEMKYTPNAIARSLAVNSTRTIGVLASDVRDSYYANAIYTIEQEFCSLGYNVILCNTGGEIEKKEMYLRVLLEKKVDGIILVGSVFKERSGNKHIYDTARVVPVVMLNTALEGQNIYSIVCDDGYATLSIVDLLYSKGHRDIVYMYDVESSSGLAKIAGFKKGMERNRLKLYDYTVVHVGSGVEGGYQGVERLEREGHPYTAVVASEDIIAAGVIKRLGHLGKQVPGDVAVFGYNNSQIALCTTPELSSVDNKVEALAKGAVKILYDVLQDSKVAAKTVITPQLIIRGSI